MKKTPEERFYSHVQKTESCWLWTGCVDGKGEYGHFCFQGRTMQAHRVAWYLCHGDFSTADDLHHVCENPRCVNPAHLRECGHWEHQLDHHEGCVTVINAQKDFCVHGHPFDNSNTYVEPGGGRKRHCRLCCKDRRKAHNLILNEVRGDGKFKPSGVAQLKADLEKAGSAYALARQYGYSDVTIHKWIKSYKKRGEWFEGHQASSDLLPTGEAEDEKGKG